MGLFNDAVSFIIQIEGGYSNDPDDRGGETRYGISKRRYPHLDIATLDLKHAEQIYFDDYWLKCRCDKLPPMFAVAVFGSAVNHGTKKAIQLLQETLRVKVDGVLGPITLAAARSQHNQYMLGRFLSYRAKFYTDIAHARPSQYKFLRGWLRRLFELQQFILEMTDAP